jgi:type IV pilus assembly protein PilC
MVYPIAVILIAMVILTAIMIFIIPKFEEIFADFGVNLPGPDGLADRHEPVGGGTERRGSRSRRWCSSSVSPPIAFIFWKVIRKTKPGKAVTDVLLLTPVFGNLIRKTTIAKFTRTLGTLIGAGVPILDAVTITRRRAATSCSSGR